MRNGKRASTAGRGRGGLWEGCQGVRAGSPCCLQLRTPPFLPCAHPHLQSLCKCSSSNLPVVRIPPLLPTSTVASLGSLLQHPLAPCLRASATFLYLFSPALKPSHLPQLLISQRKKPKSHKGLQSPLCSGPCGLPDAVPPSLDCSASLLFLEHTGQAAAFGPLHWLFLRPSPECSPHIYLWVPHHPQAWPGVFSR